MVENRVDPKEDRIQIALTNWAPRFVANGVDFNDLQRIRMRVSDWSEWCAVWSEIGEEHAALAREAEASGFLLSAGTHYFQAAMLYQFGKFMFFQDPDQHRQAHDRVVDLYRRAVAHIEYPGEYVEIPHEDGLSIRGVLRLPGQRRPPVVIISPGLDSVKEEMHCYGDDFLRRGMAVLAIDGPGQGELEFDSPMRYDAEVPIGHVIDYLETRSDVNSDRVGMMGVSLGGYSAIRAAAFDQRVRAVIALAVGYRLADYFDRVPVLTREAFVHKLKAGDEAEARRILDSWDLHGIIERVICPLLAIMGRRDRLFPAEDTERMIGDAGPNAELLMYEEGNHVCNNIPYKYRPRQADWMSEKLTQA